MKKNLQEQQDSFQRLIHLGSKGHFPIFFNQWIKECEVYENSLNQIEQDKAKKIKDRIGKHRNIMKKRTVLMSLNSSERNIFIKDFINCVENEILNSDPLLQ